MVLLRTLDCKQNHQNRPKKWYQSINLFIYKALSTPKQTSFGCAVQRRHQYKHIIQQNTQANLQQKASDNYPTLDKFRLQPIIPARIPVQSGTQGDRTHNLLCDRQAPQVVISNETSLFSTSNVGSLYIWCSFVVFCLFVFFSMLYFCQDLAEQRRTNQTGPCSMPRLLASGFCSP